MKLSKRILASLLSVAMLLTVASATAFADGPNIVPLPGQDDNLENDHVCDYAIPKMDKETQTHWMECACGQKDPDNTYGHQLGITMYETTHRFECECGYYEREEKHKYYETVYDEAGHWYECACGKVDPKGEKTPHSISMYVDNETHVQACGCGYEVPGTKQAHVFNKYTDWGDGKHRKKCECSVVEAQGNKAEPHTYGASYVTTKATLSADGALSKKCVCGAVANAGKISKIKTVSIAASVAYTGKNLKPKVTVKDAANKALIENTDYTVTYSKNKNVGKATAVVIFKGKYSGTKTLTFKIVPKTTKISSLKAGKKAFTVKYSKQTSGTGYEIQYGTSKSFKGAKTVKISKNKTVSKTVKKLKSKKTYYVRVRVTKGSSYKSSWSAVKKVKVK